MTKLETAMAINQALGELITKGFVRIQDERLAEEFEAILDRLIPYELSSDLCRFTLIEAGDPE